MSQRIEQPDDRLDAYIDGLMSTDERAAFEAEIGSSPELRRQVDLQRRVDHALRRLFEPGEPVPVPAVSPADATSGDESELIAEEAIPAPIPMAAEEPERERGKSQWRSVLVAAALLLAAGTILYVGPLGKALFGGPDDGTGPDRSITATQFYQRIVDEGFREMWVCRNDAEFKQTTVERLGAPLLVKPDPTIRLVGWRYDQTPMSGDTSVLLAEVEGQKVVVLMDRETNARRLKVCTDHGLNMFRRSLGGVVMYEITPRSQPSVIERFYDAH